MCVILKSLLKRITHFPFWVFRWKLFGCFFVFWHFSLKIQTIFCLFDQFFYSKNLLLLPFSFYIFSLIPTHDPLQSPFLITGCHCMAVMDSLLLSPCPKIVRIESYLISCLYGRVHEIWLDILCNLLSLTRK